MKQNSRSKPTKHHDKCIPQGKYKGKCFNCVMLEHFARYCPLLSRKSKEFKEGVNDSDVGPSYCGFVLSQ